MYLTEEEALKQPCIGTDACGRWVPYDREANAKFHQGAFQVYEPPPRHMCAGSACKLAWRWVAGRPQTVRELTLAELGYGAHCGTTVTPAIPAKTYGYCGLAGRPE